MVSANWRNKIPVVPGKSATGTNTATNTSEVAMTAPATSFIATEAALCGSVIPSAMWRSTFSMTTMASSTTRPVARVMPNKVSVLIENPKIFTKINVPDQRNRNGDRGNQGAAPILQEHVDDKNDQQNSLQQRDQHVANGFADDRTWYRKPRRISGPAEKFSKGGAVQLCPADPHPARWLLAVG